MVSSILLQKATVITLTNGEPIPLRNHSLLITGNKITQIGKEISDIPESALKIDCTGKIISPGFIDTHHHLWQTQLKGRHANHTLLEYYPTGMLLVLYC
jgi:cytosine/adenosine deaminase-related metal-dependent hydrolase